jgi:AbrB family looped-hinge helix DNA binding protein
METSMDRFGRIVIPKKILENFNLKAGSLIRIEEGEQKIILKPVRGEPNLHVKDGVLVFKGTFLEDSDDAAVRHRDERMKLIHFGERKSIV